MRLRARTLLIGLTVVAACLIVGHLLSQYVKYVLGYPSQLGFERLLNLDGEHNLPAWFSSLLLLLAALLLTLTWRASRRHDDPRAPYWLSLALIFLYLAVDEATTIHETIVEGLLRASLPMLEPSAYLFYPWVIAGAAFVAAVGLVYLRFLLMLPASTRLGLLVAGSLYVGGALGIDIFEANLEYTQGGRDSMSYALLVALEEGLEMAGVLSFLAVVGTYVLSAFGPMHLLVVSERDRASPEGRKGRLAPPLEKSGAKRGRVAARPS